MTMDTECSNASGMKGNVFMSWMENDLYMKPTKTFLTEMGPYNLSVFWTLCGSARVKRPAEAEACEHYDFLESSEQNSKSSVYVDANLKDLIPPMIYGLL